MFIDIKYWMFNIYLETVYSLYRLCWFGTYVSAKQDSNYQGPGKLRK